jgi:hypothetical protein
VDKSKGVAATKSSCIVPKGRVRFDVKRLWKGQLMSERMDPEADMALGAAKPGLRQKVVQPSAPRTVIVVMVCFKYGREHCGGDALAILRGMRGWPVNAAMHADRQIAYVVETHLTAQQMLNYLKEPLSAGSIDRAHAFTPGADVACSLPLDPLEEKVRRAWASVRRYNNKHRFRRLPSHIFDRVEPMAYGAKGTISTRILDDHPLATRGRAA